MRREHYTVGQHSGRRYELKPMEKYKHSRYFVYSEAGTKQKACIVILNLLMHSRLSSPLLAVAYFIQKSRTASRLRERRPTTNTRTVYSYHVYVYVNQQKRYPRLSTYDLLATCFCIERLLMAASRSSTRYFHQQSQEHHSDAPGSFCAHVQAASGPIKSWNPLTLNTHLPRPPTATCILFLQVSGINPPPATVVLTPRSAESCLKHGVNPEILRVRDLDRSVTGTDLLCRMLFV